MALAGAQIIEIRSGGSSSNAGAFNPSNVNFATDLTTDTNTGNTTAPVVSSASYNFVAGDVGYHVFIKSGTNWLPGWYAIASVASNKATLTATIGSANRWQATTILNTAAGVASVGTPTAGTWTIDYSQSNTPGITYTDMVIGASTSTYTSGAFPVGKNLIGNLINVTSGTGFTVQRVEVVSTSTITATVDKSLGTTLSTGGNARLGGACSKLNDVTAWHIASNRIFIKGDGTYTQTATPAFGVVHFATTSAPRTRIHGYTNYRGDSGQASISLSTTAGLIGISISGYSYEVKNLSINCNSLGTSTGISIAGGGISHISNCKVQNFTLRGIYVNGANNASYRNEATGGTSAATAAIEGVANNQIISNNVHDNACPGILFSTANLVERNRVTNNAGASSDGIRNNDANNAIVRFNTVYGSGRDGYRGSQYFMATIIQGNLFAKNAGYGLRLWTVDGYESSQQIDGNAYWSNGLGNRLNSSNVTTGNNGVGQYVDSMDVLITGVDPTNDPFVDKASGDFRLNNTAGAGALLRGTAYPGILPGDTSGAIGYLDFGCYQHVDPAGGLTAPIISALGGTIIRGAA